MYIFPKKLLFTALLSLGIPHIAQADDIDILNKILPHGSNVLFIMDLSGSMRWNVTTPSGGTPSTRINVLKGSFQDIINDTDFDDINIGLSIFSGSYQNNRGMSVGHGITYPVTPIQGVSAKSILSNHHGTSNQGTSYMPFAGSQNTREYLTSFSENAAIWSPFGGTPIVDALYEGVLYFRGEKVDLGRFAPSDVRSAHPSTYTGSLAQNTMTYKSPIKDECASNGIILLTDGEPTLRQKGTNTMNLMGITSCAINDYNSDGQDDFSTWNNGSGQCGKELAEYMYNTDHNLNLDGKQNIKLYTVGLSLAAGSSASSYLSDLADSGGGVFVAANNRAELTNAFKQALIGISKNTHSFSTPTYTVDTSTMLTHSENVYVPIFAKTGGSFWKGNLKKYRLHNGELYGKNNKKATDANGNLLDTVSDLWDTASTATSVVDDGGIANKINPDTRKVFTDNGSALININTVTASQLDVSNAEKSKLIDFIRGKDSAGAPRHHMGDIIHSKPIQLMTGSGSDSIIFVGTNEGFLHAIQSSTGEELFAYMPQELLKNIKPQFANTALTNHVYGVDAPITFLDDNQNGVIETGETPVIYFGLRRGGKAYYALDVSSPSSPSLKWKFQHNKLGYTWSQPTIAKLRYGGSSTPSNVVIFGGGYIDDNGIDSTTPDTDNNSDKVAAAVFIVNADTGDLIKMITGTNLQYAVPSRIKVLDMDRDGSADRLYFTDTGGHVLRVDLDPNKDNDIGDAKLTTLASLAESGASGQRKFFNQPDVALFKRGGKVVIAVSVGSGKRPEPLEEGVDNYFYMLLDENVFNTPTTSQNITPSDLFDAPLSSSQNLIAELSVSSGKRGWKKRLNQTGLKGEKSLSSSVTFQNKVMFTTFGITSTTQSTNNGVVCGEDNTNQSSLYVLDLLTGKAALDLDGDGEVNESDSSKFIHPSGEIPDTPSIVRSGWKSSTGGDCTDADCSRTFEIYTGRGPKVGGSETLDANPIPPSQLIPRAYWLDQK